MSKITLNGPVTFALEISDPGLLCITQRQRQQRTCCATTFFFACKVEDNQQKIYMRELNFLSRIIRAIFSCFGAFANTRFDEASLKKIWTAYQAVIYPPQPADDSPPSPTAAPTPPPTTTHPVSPKAEPRSSPPPVVDKPTTVADTPTTDVVITTPPQAPPASVEPKRMPPLTPTPPLAKPILLKPETPSIVTTSETWNAEHPVAVFAVRDYFGNPFDLSEDGSLEISYGLTDRSKFLGYYRSREEGIVAFEHLKANTRDYKLVWSTAVQMSSEDANAFTAHSLKNCIYINPYATALTTFVPEKNERKA